MWEKIRTVYNAWYLFIPRLIIWIGCTFIGPILLIMSKFEVFKKVPVDGGEKIQFNGWEIVIVLIIAIGVFYILKYILSAMTFNFISQIISGFINLILWLILGLALVETIAKFQEEIKWILKWSIASCSAGVIINPLPRWSYNRKTKDIANSIVANMKK